MPIVILEIPKNSQMNVSQAKELCENVGDRLHDILKVPDPNDKERRVIRSGSEETILRMSFTVGPNEYPDFEPTSFFPTKDQIESAGKSVLTMTKESQLGVSQVVIEAWRDTTFALRKGETPEPASPIPEKALREIGSCLDRPRIKIVLSPQKREGGSFSKEQNLSSEIEYQGIVSEISKRMTEMLELKETVAAEVEFADSADTDISVEFDCEVEPNKLIPIEVREYMAESVLHILDSNQTTKGGSGEVWIRQGQPERLVIN